MENKLKNSENNTQIIKHEDLAKHNNRGIYMRDGPVSYTHLTLPTKA